MIGQSYEGSTTALPPAMGRKHNLHLPPWLRINRPVTKAKKITSLIHASHPKLLKTTAEVQSDQVISIYYESALAKELCSSKPHSQRVGVLGHMTKRKALSCLQNCPLLEDLATWSQWDLVFKPELKDLKDFIISNGEMYSSTVTSSKYFLASQVWLRFSYLY